MHQLVSPMPCSRHVVVQGRWRPPAWWSIWWQQPSSKAVRGCRPHTKTHTHTAWLHAPKHTNAANLHYVIAKSPSRIRRECPAAMTNCAIHTRGHEHMDQAGLRDLRHLAPTRLLRSTSQYLMQHQTTNTKQRTDPNPRYCLKPTTCMRRQ